MLRLVHLSDIHFSNRLARIGFDPDKDLRSELALDLEREVGKGGQIDAILVSGDVAFSGKKEEYEDAAAWLDELCTRSGCAQSSVYVCPGNHDIDQAVLRENPLIQDSHDAIRATVGFAERDAQLIRRLEQPLGANQLYAPLREFNEFAARYGCSFFADATSFAWDKDDLVLDDGSILRIRGMNSALLSGLSDGPGTLFLGSRAWTMPRHPGIEYLCMAHHPPSWLSDGREAVEAINDRARIHLFGHEHDQRTLEGRHFVSLFAGAVNPHRQEPNWQPGYNILDISVSSQEAVRTLHVDVHVRTWIGSPRRFQSLDSRDGEAVHRNPITLQSWTPPPTWHPATATKGVAVPETSATDGPAPAPISTRDLVNRFFRLSLSRKNEIIGKLDLADDTDKGLPDVERFKRCLVRAKESDRIPELLRLIGEMEGR